MFSAACGYLAQNIQPVSHGGGTAIEQRRRNFFLLSGSEFTLQAFPVLPDQVQFPGVEPYTVVIRA